MSIFRFNNLQGINPEEINKDWSRSGLKNHSSLHSIASYLAMFAPALPEFFIDRFSNKGDLVMDPFSGRGTTALRARETGRKFVGSDLNPYALVLSRLKTSTIELKSILNRIDELEIQFKTWKTICGNPERRIKYKEMLIFYSPSTLKSLIFIRNELGFNWGTNNDVDNAVLAFALGIMHGPTRKDGSSIYFSLDMSNSISMSPNYVKEYARKNNLSRPKGTIFQKIRNRVISKYDEILNKDYEGEILNHNATEEYSSIEDGTIDLVVTSPPYLSVVNYTTTNWIKLWLLGYERKTLKQDIILSDRLEFEEYIIFITNFLNNLYSKLSENAHVCLIVGDVHGRKLIEDVWERIKNSVNYDFVEIYYDNYSQNKKVLNTMNDRKGKATMIEKILVVQKV